MGDFSTPVLTPYARWLIKKTTPRPVIPAFTANQLNTISRYMKNHGITDLILNAIRVERERSGGKLQKVARDYLLRLGPQAIGVFRKCKTGEIVASWHEGEIVR